MGGRSGTGIYSGAAAMATWLAQRGGMNKRCKGCVEPCKQPADIDLLACNRRKVAKKG